VAAKRRQPRIAGVKILFILFMVSFVRKKGQMKAMPAFKGRINIRTDSRRRYLQRI
jgi:hypothetical protein